MVFKQWPPLNVLRGFEAAARLGSFHQAAQELHLTQSAISQQIRSLEELLGQPLFHRQGRSVALTDAGQDLLETTQSVLLQLAMGIQRLEQYRKPNQLVLNTSTAIARHWLLPRLGSFTACIPTSISGCSPAMKSPTWPSRPSISPCAGSWPPGRVPPPAAAGRPPAAGGGPRRAGATCDRAHHPARGAGAGLAPLDPQGRRGSAAADPGLNFSDPGLLLDAACQGLGIALVSERLSRPARQQGQLLPLSTHRVKGPQWHLLVHQESETMPECRAFCHWLGQQFADGEPDREEGGVATL